MRAALVCLSLASTVASADETKWETKETSPIVIKVRDRPNSRVKEIWAEGDLNASVLDIQGTLTDVKGFTHYMPYLTEAKLLGMDHDGAMYIYSRLDMPVLSARDFIHKTYVDRDCTTDKDGVFANHWFAVPNKVPEKEGVVRLKLSEGSWLVSPKTANTSHVVYKFSVDPGGSIPAFAANMSGTGGIEDTFKAVERESLRRAEARKAGPGDAGPGGH